MSASLSINRWTRTVDPPWINQAIGGLLLSVAVCVVVYEWTGAPAFGDVGGVLAGVAVLAISPFVTPARRVFVYVGLGLVLAAALFRDDWLEALGAALASAAFIAAFFTALTSLRHAALASNAIAACGRFLAEQRPGRRYAALTLGGQLFGLILGYAAISLLGGLAEEGARQEPDPERRRRRLRRMLLAVQRGFVSTLPWSPLAFAVAISTSLVPGARWADAVLPCLFSGAILVLVGWGLDQFDKPRRPLGPPPQFHPKGSWVSLWPLIVLLLTLGVSVAVVQSMAEIRTIAIVMLAAPAIALIWLALQNRQARPVAAAIESAGGYVFRELPVFRSEILLLCMAGFIGTLGATVLGPIVDALELDLTQVPASVFLLAMVWSIPLGGQIGMNPILLVSLVTPILPAPADIGADPADYIVAITAGWALSGATSPFTATTLMIGALGGVSARRVGLRWNGAYTLVCGVLLSLWVEIHYWL